MGLMNKEMVSNLEIDFVDGPDHPQEPINDQIHGVGDRIGQVRVRQRVVT